jgi:zinc transporter ZupT
MWTFLIVSAVVLFIAILGGVFALHLINLGTLLMFAQAFSSSSFVGVAILHLMPQAAALFHHAYPLTSLIAIGVFVLLFIGELVGFHRPNTRRPLEDSQELSESYAVFVGHPRAAIPSLCLEIAVYLFFLAHSVFVAFPFVLVSDRRLSAAVPLLVVVTIEKVIEGFTVTLLFRRIVHSPAAVPLLLLYAAATPAAVLAMGASAIGDNSTACAVCLSVSAGVFLFMGVLMWRRSFLTPFDWKKWEAALLVVLFLAGIAVPACTRIEGPYF